MDYPKVYVCTLWLIKEKLFSFIFIFILLINTFRVATCFFNFFSRFSKVHTFESVFSLKLSLRLKTMLNTLKTLNIYCKATSNVFFKEIFF